MSVVHDLAAGAQVHATAVVEAGAQLDDAVVVGPYAVIGSAVRLGRGTQVGAHAVVVGRTTVGSGNIISAHCLVGGPPQLREASEAGALSLGDNNCVREFATIHVGSAGGSTVLGDGNLLLAYAHVAHDCRLGHDNELANGVQLGGQVQLGDHVCIGGLAAVHQRGRVGSYAMIAAGAMVSQDVPPYCQVAGNRARLMGLNTVGLRRHHFDAERRQRIARAVHLLYDASALQQGLEQLGAAYGSDPDIELLSRFVGGSGRGLCRWSRSTQEQAP